MTEAYEYLLENGPSELYSDETPVVPGFDVCLREGICSFDIATASPAAKSTNVGYTRKSVYYIAGEHSQEEVLCEFNAVNDGILDEMSDRSLPYRIPNEFYDVAKDVFDVSFGNGGNQGGYGGVCPCCGEEYDGELPRHLLHECKRE